MLRLKIAVPTILILALYAFFAFGEVVDKILIIVNDEIITQGEVDRILYPIYEQYKLLYSGEELIGKIDNARRNVIDRLIMDKLLFGEAVKRDIKIDEKELKDRIAEIRKRYSTDREFEEALLKENVSMNELEKMHRERLMIDKLIDEEIRKRISISPHEVLSYYEANKTSFSEPKRAKLWSILIKVTKERTDEEASELAKQILTRIEAGGDFSSLAKEYSDGPYKDNGGDMGWVEEGDLMDKINKVVFALKAGEVSGIINTSLGYHIFKAEEVVESKEKEFREVKNTIEQYLYKQKVEKYLSEWVEQLKKNAYIAFK